MTNTQDGEQRIREIYGDDVVIIRTVMPGFDLARLCAQKFAADAHADTIGMVLLKHGIFSFGNTAKESYERMVALVTRAEAHLEKHGTRKSVPTKAPTLLCPPAPKSQRCEASFRNTPESR